MINIIQLMPELEGDEMQAVQGLVQDMEESQAQTFAHAYRARRKDPNTLMLVSLAGFLGIAGIQRFMIDQMGMGIIFFLTGGFCGIGTIIDIVTHKKMAFEYNYAQAYQIAAATKGINPSS